MDLTEDQLAHEVNRVITVLPPDPELAWAVLVAALVTTLKHSPDPVFYLEAAITILRRRAGQVPS